MTKMDKTADLAGPGIGTYEDGVLGFRLGEPPVSPHYILIETVDDP